MAEILFLTIENADSCAFYRSSGVLKDLRRKTDHNIDLLQWNKVEMNWSLVSQYDIVMMQRPFSAEAKNLCGYIKLLKIGLWVDYDDNLFVLNPENPTFQLYNNPTTKENIKAILKLADVVSVPTENLKQAYIEHNKNIKVVPNAFNDALFFRPEVLPQRTNHCIWRGPEAHIYDIMGYLNEISQAATDFPEWRFMFMGFNVGSSILQYFLPKVNNMGHIPSMDVVIYFKALLDIAPSCVHVPLADNPFNRAKSNIAAIEGSYSGAVCVVPAWWNMPGTLSYTDGKSYYEAIKSVLSGEVDKVKMNAECWEYIMDCLRLSKVNEKRIEIIKSLL